mmetsp:Transcript_23340/g.56593  ORF Transcript_23340/g.56593 Transcript_23340/m.56593 type:complete len:146 (+) Transcript_23340:74-511(+)
MMELWQIRLEALALVQVGLCILGNIGLPLGSNVAVGLFTYMYCRKSGQLIFVAAIHSGSFVSDIISLCLHGSDWSGAGHEVAFGMSMMIINLFAKIGALMAMFMLYEEGGSGEFSRVPEKTTKDFNDLDDPDIKDLDAGSSYQND